MSASAAGLSGGFPMPSAAEFQAMTPDQFEVFWQTFDAMKIAYTAPYCGRFFIGQHDIRDICTLKRAGWSPEPQGRLSQLMSWFWRRPAIGKRPRGKLFQSTNQALNELIRMSTRDPKANVALYAIALSIDGRRYRGTLPAKSLLKATALADSLGATVLTEEPAQAAPSS